MDCEVHNSVLYILQMSLLDCVKSSHIFYIALYTIQIVSAALANKRESNSM